MITSTHQKDVYVEYLKDRPYLGWDAALAEHGIPNGEEIALFNKLRKEKKIKQPPVEFRKKQQAHLNKLALSVAGYTHNPFLKWGHIPAENDPVTWVTSIFMHAGWLHLLFSMLLFYLTGPFIENIWGKTVFILFFIGSGVVSALVNAALFPASELVSVGSSGAIAGVVGAFLVRYWKTHIKFAFSFFQGFVLDSMKFRGTFTLPAWAMLVLWIGSESLSGLYLGEFSRAGIWGHITGLGFGIFVALVLKFIRFEEKYIEPKLNGKAVHINENYEIYERAMRMARTGKKERAYARLMDAVEKNSDFAENVEALWRLSLDLGKEREAAPFLRKALENNIENNHLDSALVYYNQLKKHIGDFFLPVQSKVLLMGQMVKHRSFILAREFGNEFINRIDKNTPTPILLNLARAIARIHGEIGHPKAGWMLQLIQTRTEIQENTGDELVDRLSRQSTVPREENDAAHIIGDTDPEFSAAELARLKLATSLQVNHDKREKQSVSASSGSTASVEA